MSSSPAEDHRVADAAVEPGCAFQDLREPPSLPQIRVAGALHSIGNEGGKPHFAYSLRGERPGIVYEWAYEGISLVSSLVKHSAGCHIVPGSRTGVSFCEDRYV